MAGYASKLKPFITNMEGNQPLIPEGPVMPEGTIKITENGTYKVRYFENAEVDVQGGGPGPQPIEPPTKGDKISFGGHTYLVLNANGYECEVMYQDLESSKYWVVSGSPTSNEKVAFMVDGIETLGLKYEGSTLDTFCNETFFNSLPADVQGAIIDTDVVQDMYNTSAEEGTEDLLITPATSAFSSTYRIKKVNDESIAVGSRKCYCPGVGHIIDYLGASTHNEDLNKMFYRVEVPINCYTWLSDAYSSNSNNACNVIGGDGYVSSYYRGSANIVSPAFRINLQSINWSKLA